MRGFVLGCVAVMIGLPRLAGCAASDRPRAEATVPITHELVSKSNLSKSVAPAAAPETPLAAPTEIASSSDLRVMTFNVRVKTVLDSFGNSWGSRKSLLVQTIREFDPDVLGTQECLASQADDLREQLSDYGFVGAGRDDGDRGGEMCAVFFKSSKFDKIDSGHFWLSSTPDRVGSKSWGSSFVRMVTWVKLQPREGGVPFCVLNTHFDVFGKRARVESAKLLRERMQVIAPGMPCVITGDFNDQPGSNVYQTLLGSSLTDAFRATHPIPNTSVEGTRHNYSGSDSGPRIDWIVTNDAFQAVDSQIVHTHNGSKFPSDHFPVAAVLKPVAISQPVARIE